MHRLGARGLPAAALAAGLAPAALAADPGPPPAGRPADSTPWYGRLFAGPAPAKPSGPGPAAGRRPPAAPLAPEALADALKAEQDAFARRLDVCTKLRQVAAQTNNDALSEQADALERQATALYHGRVARLGVKGGPRGSVSPVPPLAVAGRRPDPTTTLDRSLGAGVAADPRAADPAADAGRSATAQLREFRRAPE